MKNIIIDTDPGLDDAVAILLAARHLNILGITTVFGNAPLENTTKNALKILEFSGLTHLPVIPGASEPLVQPARHAASVHGASGLAGPALPEPTTLVHSGQAVDFIIETALNTPEVILVPIGPLTNIALALRKEPRLRESVQEICLMGGSSMLGNVTAAAEFNIWCDPEAAHIVFSSGIPIKMVGLNLTHQAAATPAVVERINILGNRVGKIVAVMLDAYNANLKRLFGLDGGALHDPCAVAWLIDPSLITSEKLHVQVELYGEHTRGMTVCDQRNLQPTATKLSASDGIQFGMPPNAEVGMSIDTPHFIDLLVDTLAQYP